VSVTVSTDLGAQQVWQAALAELRGVVPRVSYDNWLRHVAAVSLSRTTLVLSAHNTYARDWLLDRHIDDLTATIGRIVGHPIKVDVVAGPGDASRRHGSARGSAVDATTPDGEPDVPADQETQPHLPGFAEAPPWRPNPRYRFQDFVVGPSNQLAHAAARSVAEQPGHSYNPLLLYGGVGLGKTHLLHAIAHEALSGGHRVLYVSSETFANDLISAIREHRTDQFRIRYRNADVLLVDDVQFIAGKEATQTEFFHTFNTLHEAGRQVVLSSDRPPRAMALLEERLRSRFEWGLIADIQPPDLETRTAILQAKAAAQPVPIPADVLSLLAQRVQSNIRELEGALTRVVAYSAATHRPLSVDSALSALREVMGGRARRQANMADVVAAVCRFYRVDQHALRGKSRGREIVLPRQVAMYLLRDEAGLSLSEIGRELGGRDHTTVLHGANKIGAEIEASAQLRRDVLSVRDLIHRDAGK
jgi:chromosomal replication initiator protein